MNRLINYYYEIRYRCLKAYWLCYSKFSNVHGLVLMYHHVSDQHFDTNDSCQHTISEFKKGIESLKKMGYRFVSISEALDIMRNKNDEKFAVVTFDDVSDDVYCNAYPILKHNNIPFTLFVTTNFINKVGFLSKYQLLEMDKDNLCTIGAHTVSHPMLRYSDDISYELKHSKNILEELLGHKVDYLAYPYGRQSSVSRKVQIIAKKSGYKCAFGTIQTPISDVSEKNMFYLPRVVLKNNF